MEHIVQLNNNARFELLEWLQRPNGAHTPKDGKFYAHVTFEAVEGGGILVRTRPYTSRKARPEDFRTVKSYEEGV